MPPMRTASPTEQPGERSIAFLAPLVHEPSRIADGWGDSPLGGDRSQEPPSSAAGHIEGASA